MKMMKKMKLQITMEPLGNGKAALTVNGIQEAPLTAEQVRERILEEAAKFRDGDDECWCGADHDDGEARAQLGFGWGSNLK
jgi:hypothetical protein